MHSLTWRAVARAGVIAAGITFAFVPAAAAQDPGQVGSWGALQTYPVVPVSMGVTPDGKIVAWDQANQPPNFGSVPNNGPAMVLDPATGAITRSNNLAPRITFCSLIAALPDGRLAIIGGGSDSGSGATAEVQIYDADSKTFSVAGQMNFRRWYPGGTLDRDGNPIIAGGTSTGIERVNQLTGASTILNTTFPTNWYADLIRTQNGQFVIEDVGDNATQGPGRYLLNGTTLSTISNTANLQARLRGIRTMIGPYTMFYNSGGTSTDSMIIDASGASPTYTKVANSNFRHMTGQAVTLPTGDVLAVGGNSSGSGTKGTPVMTPELYTTATNTWSSMADLARRRTYHSVAALLPDGRVWSAGSSFDEVQEPNGQFFSPPYLFRKDGSGQLATRPTATDAPASVAAGQSFSIATSNPSNIASASFIRMAGTTHQVNAGQSFVKLNVTPTAGRVSMTAPSIDQAPPGYYMVFLVDNQGVPSVAPVVKLEKTAGAAPDPRVTQSSQSALATRAWNAWDGDKTPGSGGTYAVTSSESQPWWQVDLGASRDIDRLVVTLRSDSNTERDLWVFTSDTPFNSTTVSGLQAQSGVTEYRMLTPSGNVGTAPIDTTARYIRIQDPTTSSLTLSEVEMDSPTATVSSTGSTITYQGDPGEANSVVVDDPSSTTYTFAETPIAAGAGCVQTNANLATCTNSSANVTVAMNLDDMGDTVNAASSNQAADTFQINGASGADALTGTPLGDTINGGADNDTIIGGDGDDAMDGGTGNDRFLVGDNSGDGSGDELTGGADIDRAVYTSCTTAVTVTIDGTNNDGGVCGTGSAATDDVHTDVESITGSNVATDSLTGSCLANTIVGDSGTTDDGAGAADTINGDPAACTPNGGDFLGGGEGNDSFNCDGTGATPGFDTVTYGAPYVDAAAPGISVTLDDVANDGDGFGNTDNVNGDCERIIGNAQADTINASRRRPGGSAVRPPRQRHADRRPLRRPPERRGRHRYRKLHQRRH